MYETKGKLCAGDNVPTILSADEWIDVDNQRLGAIGRLIEYGDAMNQQQEYQTPLR